MLISFLRARSEVAYALLRIVGGLMFSVHGMQKIFGILGKAPVDVGTQAWFGGLIELVCGLAIAAGALTPYAAFLASGTMAVAYVQFHWKLRGGSAFLPSANGGELALLYAFLFLYVACRGAGMLSVDARRRRF